MGCGVVMTVLQNKQLINLQQNAIKTKKSNHTKSQINASTISVLQQQENKVKSSETNIIKRQSITNINLQKRTSANLKENLQQQKSEVVDEKVETKNQNKPEILSPVQLHINRKQQPQKQANNVNTNSNSQNNKVVMESKKQKKIQDKKIEQQEKQKNPSKINRQISIKKQLTKASNSIPQVLNESIQEEPRYINKRQSKRLTNKNDISRKSLKIKKQMVHVDSLYLQSVRTKDEQASLEKSPPSAIRNKPESQKEPIRALGGKSKNEPIQIVENLAEIDKNIEVHKIYQSKQKIPITKARQPSKKQAVKKEQKNREISVRKKEDDKKKAEQSKALLQQARKRMEEQQKKNIAIQTSKLKKVYNL